MPMLGEEGRFRGEMVTLSLVNSKKSDAMSLHIQLVAQQKWHNAKWCDIQEHEIRGHICLKKKNGQPWERGFEMLVEALGWNGDWSALWDGRIEDLERRCQFSVQQKDNGQFEATWFRPYANQGQVRPQFKDEEKNEMEKLCKNVVATVMSKKRRKQMVDPGVAVRSKDEDQMAPPVDPDDDTPF